MQGSQSFLKAQMMSEKLPGCVPVEGLLDEIAEGDPEKSFVAITPWVVTKGLAYVRKLYPTQTLRAPPPSPCRCSVGAMWVRKF